MPSQINMSSGSVSIVLPKYLISGCSILPYPIYVVLILYVLYHEQNTRVLVSAGLFIHNLHPMQPSIKQRILSRGNLSMRHLQAVKIRYSLAVRYKLLFSIYAFLLYFLQQKDRWNLKRAWFCNTKHTTMDKQNLCKCTIDIIGPQLGNIVVIHSNGKKLITQIVIYSRISCAKKKR